MPQYDALFRKWEDANVITYLRALIWNKEEAEEVIEHVLSPTGCGVCVSYHERVEMTELSNYIDSRRRQPGFFADAIKKQTITQNDLMTWDRIFAHHTASQAECAFAVYLAGQSGFSTTPEAIVATKPTWIEGTDAENLREHYTNALHQLGLDERIKDDVWKMPTTTKVQQALRFWEYSGTVFPLEERMLIEAYLIQ